MNAMKLTFRRPSGHNAPMETRSTGLAGAKLVMAMSALAALQGCITIKAPEDKIVIELNINIRQEVLYRIEGAVEQAVEQNSGIF